MTNNAWNSNVPVGVGKGGTGNTTLTDHGILLGNGTSPINVASPGTAGNILLSNGPSLDPSFTAITDGGLIWSSTAVGLTLENGHGYVTTNASGTISLVLPATASIGDIIYIIRQGDGFYAINASPGQRIYSSGGNARTSDGGVVRATNIGSFNLKNTAYLTCYQTNTDWYVTGAGNLVYS